MTGTVPSSGRGGTAAAMVAGAERTDHGREVTFVTRRYCWFLFD